MRPSVGRVVHYVSLGSQGGKFPSTCRAAIITQVGPQIGLATLGPYGLAVLNPTGMFFQENVDYDETGKPGTWHWPERVE